MLQTVSTGGQSVPLVCSYCGLPLARSGWWSSKQQTPPEGPQFCCLGCQLAADLSSDHRQAPAVRGTILRLGLAIFFAMNATVFTMALWTPDFYGAQAQSPLAAVLDDLFRYGALLTSLPVAALLGIPLAQNAWAQVRRGLWGSDLLLVVGVAAAYLYSAVSVFRGQGHVYFEVGTVTLVMVTLGRWLEATGKLKTTAALDALDRLLPDRIRRVCGETIQWVAADTVVTGERVRVLPGERVPLDGKIVRGRAALDEQILSGESAPVLKTAPDTVYGGTLNLDGDLWLEVVAPQGAGTLARLIELVRTARLAKGRYEQQADRVAAGFMPAVAVLALAAGGWHAYTRGLDQGLLTGLAVVLIACPCALGLATPMAVWSALGQAAQWQVLFRNGLALERLATVRAVRFDKTGTLTTGQPRVTEIWIAADAGSCEAMSKADLAEAAWLASASTHPFSQAVARLWERPSVGGGAVDHSGYQLRSLAGKGTLATAEPTNLGEEPSAAYRSSARWLGSLAWLMDEGLELPTTWRRRTVDPATDAAREGDEFPDTSSQNGSEILTSANLDTLHARPSVAWGDGGRVRAIFWIEETVRIEAAPVLAWCQSREIDVAVLTGDRAERAAALARQLDVPVESGLLPEDKLAAVHRARQRFGAVAMVGDGINDAPALAAADVGIALGCGADVSRESAQVCLLGNDLRRLPQAMALARQTVRIVRQNLVWAFGYNIVGIGLAACGWLNPVAAACLMTVSSLLVITNSLRLSGQVAAEDEAQAGAMPPPSLGVEATTILPGEVRSPGDGEMGVDPAAFPYLPSREAVRHSAQMPLSGSVP